MGNFLDNAVIAVDGGGTSCRIALDGPHIAVDGRQVVVEGAANVTSDFEGAVASLLSGFDRLAHEADLSRDALFGLPAYLGLAGVVDKVDAARVARALPFSNIAVSEDTECAVRGALGTQTGALAGLGTGSFFAHQDGAIIRAVGGWGSRLGDTASGFWIGREALSAALDVLDGLIAPSGLTSALLARFDGSGRDIVNFGFGEASAIATLAPQVIDLANSGDPVGHDILARGAAHIADIVMRIGWQSDQPLCLIGGVSAAYHADLPAPMQAALIEPLGTALDGAVALARKIKTGEPV